MNKQTLKSTFLLGCKFSGLFGAARYLTRNRLRILCYHGISRTDEHEWRPALYMTPSKFAARMDFLRAHNYPVLPLNKAVQQHTDDELPAGATVITFDDGFKDFYDFAVPILRKRKLPATLYVTTYYAVKQTPIFRLALSYVFWRARCADADLRSIDLLPTGLRQYFLLSSPDLERRIVRHAEINLSDPERNILLSKIASAVGINFSADMPARLFEIVSKEEMGDMASGNFDIQLHTHRHRFPDDPRSAMKELEDNRHVLGPIVGATSHFCFPSGLWSKSHLPTLRDAGILSATTCDEGLNKSDADPLTLKRFLDGTQVSDLRFEAEMSGLMDLLRDAASFFRRVRSKFIERAHTTNPIHAAE